ncbi:signal peptidase II [Candidatus Pantoea edessiphila]|uniref:Lipoprotein signal peptidase n=2 Tax=Candidatus Pantoea edessiphila TaxID=2044610 RepID=A0A2P5SWC0_9GAMM|nr:signal peptidase II [Candidatus Pantoea edessiphila]
MKNSTNTLKISWLSLAFMIAIIDNVVKQVIMHNIILKETYQLTSFLNLFYCHNYGIAFSFLSDGNKWQHWLFIIITIIIIITLLVSMYYSNNVNNMIYISYTFIIGGALGNLFDRFYHGFVVDFIDFHIQKFHFATFNIADCFIFIGLIFFVLNEC